MNLKNLYSFSVLILKKDIIEGMLRCDYDNTAMILLYEGEIGVKFIRGYL